MINNVYFIELLRKNENLSTYRVSSLIFQYVNVIKFWTFPRLKNKNKRKPEFIHKWCDLTVLISFTFKPRFREHYQSPTQLGHVVTLLTEGKHTGKDEERKRSRDVSIVFQP